MSLYQLTQGEFEKSFTGVIANFIPPTAYTIKYQKIGNLVSIYFPEYISTGVTLVQDIIVTLPSILTDTLNLEYIPVIVVQNNADAYGYAIIRNDLNAIFFHVASGSFVNAQTNGIRSTTLTYFIN